MTEFTSDIVAYHEQSPDPIVPHCQNTGDAGDGVVFLGVEPMVGSFMFIGRQSLVEAAAVMYGLSPDEVVAKLSAKPKRAEKRTEVKVKSEGLV